MTVQKAADTAAGLLLLCITILVLFQEWSLAPWLMPATPVLLCLVLLIFAVQVRIARKAFILVGGALTIALAASNSDWQAVVLRGLGSAAFIAAFFCSLATLRNVTQTSPAIQQAGRFLSSQPPGRRYAALTLGGQMFALLLSYGAIQLLGALASSNARAEPDAEVRAHRTRRMLLAIQRAFISTLSWSPLSLSVAITTTLIPGTSWGAIALPGLVTSAILAGIGWGLDSAFKPRLTTPPARSAPVGSWRSMAPLVWLLVMLVISVIALYLQTGVRVIGIVMLVVPIIAFVWLTVQSLSQHPLRLIRQRLAEYVVTELPGYRSELTLLMMAGFIGTVGAQLLLPVMTQGGWHLEMLPTWLILVAFVWLLPLCGQFGMNPILSFTLIAPLIPAASILGVSPTAIVVAATAGWSLSGASSPFTATTLLTGSFAGISALRVGLVWNGVYSLICGAVLSLWVLLYAFVLHPAFQG